MARAPVTLRVRSESKLAATRAWRATGSLRIGLPGLMATTVVFGLLHLAMAGLVPLVQDEAYYALWATRPALDYYDHPAMVAWWIWLGERILGANTLGVRAVSVLAFAALTPIVWRMAWLATRNRRTANIAAIFVNGTILVLILGFTATPDSPSVLFWTIASWSLIEALCAPTRGASAWWWLLLGVAAGLGVQSKFTNLFLGVGLAGWLTVSIEGRAHLRRTEVWIAAAAALLIVAPLLWWNYRNGGLGLVRQFGRLKADQFAIHWTVEYLLTLFVVISPAIAWAFWSGAIRARGHQRVLVWLTAPLLAYMLLHSVHAQVQANWLVPVFPDIAVLAAIGAATWSDFRVAVGAGTSVALGVLAFLLALSPGAPIFPGDNPPNQTKGWPEMIAELSRIAAANGAVWIATTNYGLTGSLAYYLPKVPVWAVSDQFRYGFRGPFPSKLCGASGLLVTEGAKSDDSLGLFSTHGSLQTLVRRSAGATVARYSATPVSGIGANSGLPCGTGQANGTATLLP